MHSGKLSLGLIVSFLLVVCQPQANEALYAPSDVYERELETTQNEQVRRDFVNFEFDSNKQKQQKKIQQFDALSSRRFDGLALRNIVKYVSQFKSYVTPRYLRNKTKVKSGNKVTAKLAMPETPQTNETSVNKEELSTKHNISADVEEFDVVDNNQKHERTFSFITDFISNLMNRRTCVYPCTLEAYQENNCCPPELVQVPVPVNTCQTCAVNPIYPQPIFRPPVQAPIPQPIPYVPQAIPQNLQCCSVCTQYTLYGPPPCLWGMTTHFRQRTVQQTAF